MTGKAEIRIEGLDRTLAALDNFGEVGHREAMKAVRSSLEMIRSTALKKIQRDTKSGRVYTHVFRTFNGQAIPFKLRSEGFNLSPTHQASAPGEAPASDTGVLASSIKVVMDSAVRGKVGSNLKYAFWLEYGTTKMAARPFLIPSMNENRLEILEKFAKALNKAVGAYNAR